MALENIIVLFQTLRAIVAIMFVVFLIFGIITVIKYIHRKLKVALYLSLNYFLYTIAVGIMLFSYQSVLVAGYKTVLYYQSSGYFLAIATLGTMALYMFFSEINVQKLKTRIIILILGAILFVWILLPFNNWSEEKLEGFQFRYITYLLTLVYFCSIYIGMAINFFKTYSKVTENRTELLSIAIGCIVFSSYFVLITIYGISQTGILLMIGMLIILMAEIFFFFGFIFPSVKTTKPLQYTSKLYMFLKGIAFLLLFQLLHFLYEWTHSPIAAIFSGIDESNFQHWKIGFWVYLIIMFLELKIFAKQIERKQDFIFAGLFSAWLVPWMIFILWYSIQSFAGPFAYEIVEVIYAIVMTYLAALALHLLNKEIIQIHFSKIVKIIILILVGLLVFELIFFTFVRPPWVDVFEIPEVTYL